MATEEGCRPREGVPRGQGWVTNTRKTLIPSFPRRTEERWRGRFVRVSTARYKFNLCHLVDSNICCNDAAIQLESNSTEREFDTTEIWITVSVNYEFLLRCGMILIKLSENGGVFVWLIEEEILGFRVGFCRLWIWWK